jgi:hypothetical protein
MRFVIPVGAWQGIASVLRNCGHQVIAWDPATKPTFDLFREEKFDFVFEHVGDIDRAMLKNLKANKGVRLVLWVSEGGQVGEQEVVESLLNEGLDLGTVFVDGVDDAKGYQWEAVGVGVVYLPPAADTFAFPLGKAVARFGCDLALHAHYRPALHAPWLHQVCHPDSGLNVRLFGKGWPYHQYLGEVNHADLPSLYASAKVCPHFADEDRDRPFNVAAAGGFCLSLANKALDDLLEGHLPMARTPAEFLTLLRYFAAESAVRERYAKDMRKYVLLDHTYFHRTVDLCRGLGLEQEAMRVRQAKNEALQGQF